MGKVVGIDLGTTNSVISFFHRGRAETILIDGKNIFPSVVSIRDDKVIAGFPAKARLIMDPIKTIGSTKRDMGSKTTYIIGGRKMTPEDVACEILKAMKEKAEFTLGEKIVEAVVTVPAYFKSEQREATRRAAEKAGFKVLRLMPEPTAAAVCYGLNQNKDQTIMVYDLGGGTFDVTILKVKGNKFEVVAVDGDGRLGGDDFDEKICQCIYQKIKEDLKTDLNIRKEKEYMIAKQKIKEAAERAKIELSDKESTNIILPNLINNYQLDFDISRDEYYEAIKPLLDRTVEKMKNVLNQAEMTPEDIDRVVLVGGSTKAPIIKELLKREIRDPFVAPNVDEVVSNGAAILAASMSEVVNEKGHESEDFCFGDSGLDTIERVVFSYGIDMVDDNDKLFFKPIVSKGAVLPAKSGVLGITRENQTNVVMDVYRGESSNLLEDEKIGTLDLKVINPRKAPYGIGAIFEIDNDMIIHFTAIQFVGKRFTESVLDEFYDEEGKLSMEIAEGLINSNEVRVQKIDIEGK